MDWKKVKQHIATTTVEERNSKRQAVSEKDVEIFEENYGKVASKVVGDTERKSYISSAETKANQGAIEALELRRQRAEQYLQQNKDKYKEPEKVSSAFKDYGKSIEELGKANLAVKDYWGQWESEEDYKNYLKEVEDYERLEYLNIKEARDKKSALEQELDSLRKETGGTVSTVSSALSNRGKKIETPDKANIDRVKALQQEIDSLGRDITLASRIQTNKYLTNRAVNAEDFEEFSSKGANTVNPSYEKAMDLFGEEVANPVAFGREHWQAIDASNKAGYLGNKEISDSSIYRYMKDEEVKIYNYYLGKFGKEKAQEYLDSIREDLNKRQAEGIYSTIKDKSLLEIAYRTGADIENTVNGFQGAVDMLMGKTDYKPTSAIQYASQMAYEGLSDFGPKIGFLGDRSLGQITADALGTTAAMAPSIAIGTLTGTGTLAFGVSAAGNAYQEKINEGYSREQASAYGAIIGVSEATLEKVVGAIGFGGKTVASKAFGKLLPKIDNAAARIAVKYGTSALSEGFEEGLQDVLEPLYRNILFGENNKIEITEDAIYSAILGALSGGLMEGTPYAVGEISNVYHENKIKNKFGRGTKEIIESGLSAPADSELYIIAQEAKAKVDSGERLSDTEIEVLADMTKDIKPKATAETSEPKTETTAEEKSETPQAEKPQRKTFGISEAEMERIAASLPDATKDTGKQIAAMYDPADRISKGTFIRAAAEAYRYGELGSSIEDMNRQGTFVNSLSEEKRAQAYYIGKNNAEAANLEKARAQQAKILSGVKGKVIFEGDAATQIKNDQQRVTVRLINSVLKHAGNMEYHVFASFEQNGERVYKNSEGKIVAAPNGFYNPDKHQIWLDVNAGAKGQGIMLYTLTHEHIHDIKVWSAEHYNKLAEIVSEAYEHAGKSFSDAVSEKYAQYHENHPEYTPEDAQEEVIADAMSTLLSDEKGLRELSEQIQKQDKSLWNRIKAWFKDVIARISKAYEDTLPESYEARMLMENKELFEKAQKVFAEAIVTAGENYKNIGAQSSTGQVKEQEAVKYEIRKEYASEIDLWVKDGRPDGKTFVMGSTGEVLQGLGAIESDIYIEGNKINKIFEEHPEMTLEEIKKIPQILENPVFILKSRNIGRKGKANTRLVMFGTVKAQNQEPVLAILDLKPVEKNLVVNDMQKVSSAYTKNHNPKEFIRNSEVLFTDKKRTTKLLRSVGFQMPIDLLLDGYIGNISYSGTDVNLFGKPFSDVVLENDPGTKFQDRDSDYMEAVESGDMEAAQKLVDEAAKEAGYDSPMLYHGTGAFGFTEFDLSKMDDRRSIFLTDSERIASTYSGVEGKREIGKKEKTTENLSVEELAKELNRYPGESEMQFTYDTWNFEKQNKLIQDINKGIDKLKSQVGKQIEVYAEKLAKDFAEGDYKTHSQLVKLEENLENYRYKELSTPIYLLLHMTDVFNENAEEIAEFERNIRLLNKFEDEAVRGNYEVIVQSGLDGYSIELFTPEYAKTLLEVNKGRGNYSLYADLGRSLEIDAEGQVWNHIQNWWRALRVTDRNTYVKKTDKEFQLIRKEDGNVVEGGKLEINDNNKDLSEAQIQYHLVGKANNMLSILAENAHTTRDISAWAKNWGYNSVVFKGLKDNGGRNYDVDIDETANIYIIFDPNRAKSADPVTYDDNGNVIPLSERFKKSNPDIRYQLRDVEPVQPSSDKWQRTSTTSEVMARFPDLWNVTAEESDVRNPTQVKVTLGSYRKIYDFLKNEGFNGKILDASSGLGHGTRAGIEEYGFDVEDIEPYPDKSYHPKYKDYSKLNKKYDVIISNAVLNVIPQDQRDALVVKMGELLNEGGRMFINVRGKDVENASSKVAINEDLMEYYISSTGSYQKGFTRPELVAYLQDALGDGFTVTPTNLVNGVAAVVTKKTDSRIRYQDRNYKNALTKDEYERARTAIINNHKGVLIKNCAVRVIDYDNTDNSKIVCYNKLENDFEITDVYLIENYDYTIFSNYDDPAEIIAKGVKNGYSFSTIKSLLQDGEFDVGYVFRRYNIESDSFDEIGKYIETSKQTGRAKSLRERLLEEDREDLIAELDDDSIIYQERLSNADKNRLEILENKNARLEKELADIQKAYDKAQEFARAEGVLAGQIEQGKQMSKEMRLKQEAFNRKAEAYEKAIAKKKELIEEVRTKREELLAKAKAEKAEAVARVRKADAERMEKAIADVKAKERAKFKEAFEKHKERENAIRKEYQESRKKATEGRHRTDIRGKIKRVVGELNTLLTKQTKERHIPLELQKPVADALDILNLDDQRYYESRIRGLEARIAEAKNSEERHILEEELNKVLDQRTAFKDKIEGLKKAYEAIRTSTDPYIAVGYNENIAKMIDRVAEDIGDTLLRDMNMTQLQEVYDLYKGILKTVRDANKFFNEEKGASVVEAGRNVVSEIEASGKTIGRISKSKLERKKFFWNNLKPVYAFKKLGSKTLENLFGGILKGQGTWAKDISEAKDFFERTGNKYGYKKWDKKKTFEFSSNTGKKFSLNLQQMMSLYAYSKRDQAFKHLTDGGFVFDSKETIKKNGKEYVVNTAQAFNISAATLQEIIGKLSTDQRMFVDEMQKYLSETMGAKGNEVSRAMYDIELFREAESYFPLKSAKQFLYDRNEVTNETRQLVNSGFTKPIQPGANNPIILTGFMDVWANHVNDMSMYHAFVMPIENFNKVYNFQFGRSEESDSKSVKSAIQDSFTEAANQYIEQLLKDINGGARTDPREGNYKRLIGNWKKAAVFASASVVVQQPSAIGRAFSEINPVYFMAPTEIGVLKHKKQWEQLKKYAPVAVIKEMGYFDTDMGQSTAEFIKGEKTLKDRADDIFGFAPAKADEYTWCAIWDAVKRETKAKHKDLNVNSDEFLKIAGERFTEVIDKTQVYDSVLSRSGNMRSKSIFMQMLTAFMAEPTTSANMVEQAFREAKAGHPKKAMAYVSSVGASVVLNSLLVSFVYALRDDDEDERFHEKYLESLLKELADGFNPLTYVPLVKDIWSIFQGWDVERVDMSLFKDLYDNLEKEVKKVKELIEGIMNGTLSEEEIEAGLKEVGEYMLPVLDTIASMKGIPLKNLRRDFVTMPKNAVKIFENQKELSYSEKYLKDILHEAALDQAPFGHIFFESKDEKLFDAFESGDSVYVDRLKRTYSSEEAYDNAAKAVIKKALISGEFSESQAKTYLMNYGGMNLDDAESYVHSWSFEEKYGFAWSDMAEAFANGQISETKLKQAVIYYKEYSADETDKAEKEVEKIKFKAENGFDYSERINEYIDGNITKQQLKKALMEVDGKTSEEADMQIKLYDLQKAGFYEVTEYAVEDYYEFIEPAGISEEVYFKFFEETKDIKADKDSNGEGIAYSKTKKIMPYIAKLPISAKQKTAVAKSFDWEDSTINKYKLW